MIERYHHIRTAMGVVKGRMELTGKARERNLSAGPQLAVVRVEVEHLTPDLSECKARTDRNGR